MGKHLDFISKIHRSTSRDYLKERVLNCDKAACARVAKKFGKDYWDGDRKYGYGGYRYDGRWRALAQALARHYRLKSTDRILDVGCGKGYLLYEFTQVVPGIRVEGIDISRYAIRHGKEEVKSFLRVGDARRLPYKEGSFDFVISINVLHNFENFDLDRALREIERVSRGNKKYIVVDSYHNDREKVNLMYWQLTCESFYTPKAWEWVFKAGGYRGDYGFITYP